MAVGTLASQKLDAVNGIYTASFTADTTPTASGIYIGFIPRIIKMTQLSGSPDATSRSYFFEGMTAATAVVVAAAGDLTIAAATGYTLTTGNETTVVAKATNSPNASGEGFVIGVSVQATSIGYFLEVLR